MTYRIPLVESSWDEREKEAIAKVVESGRFTMGERVEEFEAAFAKRVNAEYGIMVNSGSSALLLAAFWYNMMMGGVRVSVVAPAVTWPTTVFPFMQAGFRILFLDVDPETLVMRYEGGPYGTDGMCHIPVHLMGNKAPIPEYGRVIEDSCESLQPLHGSLACYSLFFSHHLNTVEGGMIVANDLGIADWLRCARSHGWIRHSSPEFQEKAREEALEIDSRFFFHDWGFNVRPMEIQAAVGLVQLEKLDRIMEERLHAYLYMAEHIACLADRVAPMRLLDNEGPFAFPLICKDAATKKLLQSALESMGVETRPIAAGNLTRQPALRKHLTKWIAHRSLSGADRVHDCGFFIGLYPGMDVDYIVKSIKQVMA